VERDTDPIAVQRELLSFRRPAQGRGAGVGIEDLALDREAVRAVRAVWSASLLPEEIRGCLATLPLLAAGSAEDSGIWDPELRWSISEAEEWGVFMGVAEMPSAGRIALTVVPQGEAPAGPRVGSLLREAVQRMARDEPADELARVQGVAGALLPRWVEGLDHLGDLRWGLLCRVAVAVQHAARVGASAAILLTHEIVSLTRTREARRRNNREDLDRFVRRLSEGTLPRLQRGILSGPLPLEGSVPLYLGKVRRDLP